jgi:predicted branched-subunit amino acid permease
VTASAENESGGPVSRVALLLGVGVLFVVLALEPALSWFVIPALLVGLMVALILRSSTQTAPLRRDQAPPEIQIAKIPVTGGMGLVFTVGTIAIFCLALPEARWFVALAIPAGVVVAIALRSWRKRHHWNF